MFKHILPQEAHVHSRAQQPTFDRHLQQSAFAPLATAVHSGATRLLKRLSSRRFS
ncbi:MAG: hypothetical protein GX332_02195 [Alcaligenaceae bacterium]|uniref:Uncharacterized protein n=1 Tax=Paenalcaligenes hermetiae TaxID=1157987 RepID=A0ABP9LY42_9BURK|nr:hypothetical protein [Paenalcaligenes sp.]NLJ62108.1 hypothetical protein [Alcaligenaceae bacterium]